MSQRNVRQDMGSCLFVAVFESDRADYDHVSLVTYEAWCLFCVVKQSVVTNCKQRAIFCSCLEEIKRTIGIFICLLPKLTEAHWLKPRGSLLRHNIPVLGQQSEVRCSHPEQPWAR